jgi:hypothetical protein
VRAPAWLAVGIAGALLAACSGEGATSSAGTVPGPPESPTTETAGDAGPTIPNGDYRKVIRRKDWRRLGIDMSARELELAPDGTLTNVIRILGEQWVQLANYNGDPPAVGSHGTLRYDAQGRLVVDEPCCGKSRYTWTLSDDVLELVPDLEFAKAEHPDYDADGPDWLMWQMMSSGVYTKVG